MNNSRKVLHIATSNSAGAGTAPNLIHEKIKAKGHFSKILVHGLDSKPREDTLFYFNKNQIFQQRLSKAIKRRIPFREEPDLDYYFFNSDESENYISAKRILDRIGFIPDTIILYWVSNFVNTQTIRDLYLATKAKIVWVMTDMGPYTGGCHYSWDCKGYEHNCSSCPALKSMQNAQSKSSFNLLLKQKNLHDIPIEIVASYGESIEMTRKSSLFKDKVIHPHYLPVNISSYSAAIRQEALSFLKLQENRYYLFFGASSISEKRKGFGMLIDALKLLSKNLNPDVREKLTLLIAGSSMDSDLEGLNIPCHHLGFLDFKSELPYAFMASNAYLSPSLQDTGPYMINLAIGHACPVISFDVGVAKALVKSGETGYKATHKTVDAYADALLKFLQLSSEDMQQMKYNCAAFGQKELAMNLLNIETYGC